MKQRIIQLHLEDVSEREISRKTGKARNTVRKYIKQFERSRHDNVQDLPITEEVLREPTYKKRKGTQKALTNNIKKKLRGYIKDNRSEEERRVGKECRSR